MRIRSLVASLAFAAISSALPAAANAQAGNYFLDSRDPNNGFDVLLSPGFWNIVVAGGAWSPWNYVSTCDVNGANCHTGFHTIFYYVLGNDPIAHWGIDGSEFETPTHSDFYATPDLALAHAFGPLQLFVTTPTTLHAFIPDCCYWDNTGGMTIAVSRGPVTAAPEPASIALLATGLGGLGVFRNRRQRNRTLASPDE